jgi:CO/xanthine dehydrogenase Mo-binding subunit
MTAPALQFRRALMNEYPKHLAVLNAAAEKGDWGKPLPAGVHRGIAQFMGYDSYSTATAEVSVSPQGKLKVHRMVLALNCGHAVNPNQIEAQIQGSVALVSPQRSTAKCRSRRGAWSISTSTRTRSCISSRCRRSRR